MKMSDAVEWALHSATLLAVLPPGKTLSGKALAEYHGVSESYLLKNLKLLTAANLLESVPGPKGGYRMARAPKDITLQDIMEAVEGTEPMFTCARIRERVPFACPPQAFAHPCAIHVAMLKAEQAYRQALGQQTLADIMTNLLSSLHPDLRTEGEVWLSTHLR